MLYLLFSAMLLANAYVGARVVWALRRYEYRPIKTRSYSDDLPSVSVCIAARNEMHALSQCLDYILTNTYEKLEVLVLDDSSTDSTSRIIESYANAGVRFVPGSQLPSGWLGKNHAYQTLAEEASGDYVVFVDVDTLLAPSSIRQLVEQLKASKKKMVSVLPRREDGRRLSATLGTIRYLWELVLASKQTPPSSSALWLIHRQTLLSLDRGFQAYGRSVRPEAHIAKQLQKTKEYYYIVGTNELGVRYEKRLHSQYETAQRLYYPLAGHSPIRALIALASITVIVVAYPAFIIAFIDQHVLAGFLFLFTAFISNAWFGIFTIDTYSIQGRMSRIAVWPFIALQEVILLIYSMLRYATKTIQWKGRAVQARAAKQERIIIDE